MSFTLIREERDVGDGDDRRQHIEIRRVSGKLPGASAAQLLERLAPWHNNRLSRLVKTPELHMGDIGLACAFMGIDAATLLKERERLGPLLETFVLQELRRQASWRPDPIEFFHYRDRDDFEVDIVLEFGSTAWPESK